jgi:hypothetical protein
MANPFYIPKYGPGGKGYGKGRPTTSPNPSKGTPTAGAFGSSSSSAYGNIELVRARNAAAKSPALGDPYGSITGVQAGLEADFAKQAAEIAAYYNSQMGGGDGGAGAAIAEALDLIRNIDANRSAIKGVYDERATFIDPLSEAAIEAAKGIVSRGQPVLKTIASEGQAGIEGSFDEAEAEVQAAAELIGAGQGAADSVISDTIDGEALRIAAAMEEAATADNLLGLSGKAAETGAVAQRDLDNDEINRRARLVDLQFEGMREEAEQRLAAARRAAAAAAARRAAMARQRNAALAELESEKAKSMRLNPHEAGEATALSYLGKHARNLDYNRQQLLVSTVGNALSEQISSNNIPPWLSANEIGLNKEETALVQNAMRSYTEGMRFQQRNDKTSVYSANNLNRSGR